MSLTAEQLAERKNYVGASEVAAALGLSRFKSRLELYLDKTTVDREYIETPAMRFGTLMERHVLEAYEKMVAPGEILSPHNTSEPLAFTYKCGVITCHLDGIYPEAFAVVEAKTARNRDGWGDPSEGYDALPADYIFQVQTQMKLTGYRMAYIPVLFRDSLDLVVYESTFDAELAEMIVDGVHEFWQFVERREPPTPDWKSPVARELIAKVYPGTDGGILRASIAQNGLYAALCEAQEREANAKKAADGLKAMLLWDMQNAAELRFEDGKMLRRKRVDKKGYEVAPSSYIDARLVNIKEQK